MHIKWPRLYPVNHFRNFSSLIKTDPGNVWTPTKSFLVYFFLKINVLTLVSATGSIQVMKVQNSNSKISHPMRYTYCTIERPNIEEYKELNQSWKNVLHARTIHLFANRTNERNHARTNRNISYSIPYQWLFIKSGHGMAGKTLEMTVIHGQIDHGFF